MPDLGRAFLAAAARSPGACAIVDGERRLTYSAWIERIGRAVAGLDALGLRRGDHLVTVLRNRLEAATLHWACQFAGVVITPVNWRAPRDELDYVLDDACARALVYEPVSAEAAAGAPAAPAADIPRIALDGARGATDSWERVFAAAGGRGAAPVPRAALDDVSLMLYTSGTTGRGKGVPRRHRAEDAAALSCIAHHQYRFGESTLGVMPLYHTMGVRALLASAYLGGCFVCQPRFDPAEALDLIETERISALFLVPTLYHDLLSYPAFSPGRVASVRRVSFAGMPMTDALVRRVKECIEPEHFVNHYGSSEVFTFTIDQQAHAKPGSAGRAGLNQEVRVVRLGSTDPGEVVESAGEEGQIAVRLDHDEAFDGYWRRPDADAKALHDGWYFTGDTGYQDEEGDLFVTGRVDDMIISGGENITPVEVENVLSLHPAVAEVAVAGLPDDRWGQRVAAFVVRREAVAVEALDKHCRASTLPDFKRPKRYAFLRAIPKSPVGKILRRWLVAGEYEAAED